MQLMILENLKKENVEIYLEYLNSCKSSNWETWETTYKTYCNNFKLFLVWFQKNYKNRFLLSKDTLLKFSNQDSFSGLKNFEILAKDGTFFMRISKTPSFYIFEIFLQVSKYFIGTWYRDSELIFVQIS